MNIEAKVGILEQEIFGILAVDVLVVALGLEDGQHDVDAVALGAQVRCRAHLAADRGVEGLEALVDPGRREDYGETDVVGGPDHGLHVWGCAA